MALEKLTENGHTYFKLFISCPVCVDQGKNTPQSFWAHYGCVSGGSIYVGDNAYFKCDSCSKTNHVKYWSFTCPTHSSGTDQQFLKPSSQAMAQAISTAGQMVTETGQRWLIEFLKNMGEY